MTRAAAHEKSVSVGRQAGHATEQKINIVVDASNFCIFDALKKKAKKSKDEASKTDHADAVSSSSFSQGRMQCTWRNHQRQIVQPHSKIKIFVGFFWLYGGKSLPCVASDAP